MAGPDKRALLDALCEQLQQELDHAHARAREAAEESTHEELRPEDPKDMRSTEASYLARGQAARVLELDLSLQRLRALSLTDFLEGAPIAEGALVELEHQGRSSWHLLLPVAGGRTLAADATRVGVLTPASPLGEALLGWSEGDEVELNTGGARKRYLVLAVR